MKNLLLVVCGAMPVFILAEDEIDREIMLFPQFVFSLELKAVLLLSAHTGRGRQDATQLLLR